MISKSFVQKKLKSQSKKIIITLTATVIKNIPANVKAYLENIMMMKILIAYLKSCLYDTSNLFLREIYKCTDLGKFSLLFSSNISKKLLRETSNILRLA